MNTNYKISITTPAPDADGAKKLADLLQSVAQTVDYADIVKLLSKVKKNPAIVKTALKFI
jgi:hypothetical protein